MSPLCSRNARSQKTLVGRAQWGTHPSHPLEAIVCCGLDGARRVSARQGWAGEKSGLFEQPARLVHDGAVEPCLLGSTASWITTGLCLFPCCVEHLTALNSCRMSRGDVLLFLCNHRHVIFHETLSRYEDCA